LRNRTVRSSLRTYRTRAERAITTAPNDAEEAVRRALSALDRASRKGVIHPNKAARTKSRLARRLNAAVGAQSGQG
jgi:small subunit ribosomal protein S20